MCLGYLFTLLGRNLLKSFYDPYARRYLYGGGYRKPLTSLAWCHSALKHKYNCDFVCVHVLFKSLEENKNYFLASLLNDPQQSYFAFATGKKRFYRCLKNTLMTGFLLSFTSAIVFLFWHSHQPSSAQEMPDQASWKLASIKPGGLWLLMTD